MGKFRLQSNGQARIRRTAILAVADDERQLVRDIVEDMRSFAAYESSDEPGHIHLKDTMSGELETFTGVMRVGSTSDHAQAQEFGRPDLVNYHFTPFLRPALVRNMGKRGERRG
ncbi:hypothetical protein ACIBSW_34575 [Actinoplanes sp. NPDC049668]|uniref:hypothetical protein n=1 Tax=unclassified Actinoplanes TaxID=2626549 RepID=UPI0033A84F25